LTVEVMRIETRRARSTATWTAPFLLDETHVRILAAVAASHRTSLRSDTGDRLVLGLKSTLYTWGTTITIELAPVAGGTLVVARTTPIVRTTLLDWGEGPRDLRALHDAVMPPEAERPATSGSGHDPSEPPLPGGVRAWPKGLVWTVVIAAGLLLVLALVNLVVNTAHIGTWLPLLLLTPFSLAWGLRSLRSRR
jgi:hypothetical protein